VFRFLTPEGDERAAPARNLGVWEVEGGVLLGYGSADRGNFQPVQGGAIVRPIGCGWHFARWDGAEFLPDPPEAPSDVEAPGNPMGPVGANSAADPSPATSEADPETKLAEDLRTEGRGSLVGALLVEYMMGKRSATALAIAENVHKTDVKSNNAIKQNCWRVTHRAHELGLPLRYQFRSEQVWKSLSPR
jgi:hypothetical protein